MSSANNSKSREISVIGDVKSRSIDEDSGLKFGVISRMDEALGL